MNKGIHQMSRESRPRPGERKNAPSADSDSLHKSCDDPEAAKAAQEQVSGTSAHARFLAVGFTGSRDGITEPQRTTLASMLQAWKTLRFHHGDCVGADDQAANIAHDCGIEIVSHPATSRRLRAFNRFAKVERPKRPYLARNRDIVAECDILVACPKESTPQYAGGTWFTYRYASSRRPTLLIWPDGSYEKGGAW